ncbi:MAG: GDP-mannose 4,6-dehydratase, partial [Candidatus Marinimicrobia bacterium]|nr:GDP-mannose 4,6-dehydratase [Candidatus Neomarinimicrobiota bacterium]
IGFHLAKSLIERGDEVVGLDNINDYYDVELKYARLQETGIIRNKIAENKLVQSNKYSNYKFIKLDLADRENILDLFNNEKFDKVVNLAAQAGVRYSIKNPFAYIDSNVVGFMNILEGCRHNNIKHLVYASSSSVYGNSKKMPLSTSDNVDHPISLYAATKKSNELMAHTYSHLYGLPTTGLRFFTVYGPWGRPDMAYFLFTKAIIENRAIDVYNYGDMKRDFTYVDDVIEGVMRVIDNSPKIKNLSKSNLNPDTVPDKLHRRNGASTNAPYGAGLNPDTVADAPYRAGLNLNPSTAPYKIYNIGNSSPVQLLDFIVAIEKALGKKAKMNMMGMQPGDVSNTHSDVTDLIENFNYKPNTSIKEGIKKFIEWYKKYYYNI